MTEVSTKTLMCAPFWFICKIQRSEDVSVKGVFIRMLRETQFPSPALRRYISSTGVQSAAVAESEPGIPFSLLSF